MLSISVALAECSSDKARKTLKAFYFRSIVAGLAQGAFFSFYPLYAFVSGLSASQIAFAAALSFLITMLAEIPTGLFSDRKSRKLSVLLGCFCFILSVYFMMAMRFEARPLYFYYCLSSLFFGLGVSFRSGALTAWFVDEIKYLESKKIHWPRLFAVNRKLLNLTMILGAFLIYYLFHLEELLSLKHMTLWALLGLYVLQFVVVIFLKERSFSALSSVNAWQQLSSSFRLIFKNFNVKYTVFVSMALFTFLEVLNLFYPVYFGAKEELYQKAWYWVPVVVMLMVAGRLLGNQVIIHLKKFSAPSILLISALCCVLPLAFLFLFEKERFFALYLAVFLFALARVGEGLAKPSLEALVNENIPSDLRSSVLSVESLLSNLLIALFLWGVPQLLPENSISLIWLIVGILYWATSLLYVKKVKSNNCA